MATSDELVEKVARAIYESMLSCEPWDRLAGPVCDQYLVRARAALEASGIERIQEEARKREAQVRILADGVSRAAETFTRYAKLHNEKGTEEGRLKAAANAHEANTLWATLVLAGIPPEEAALSADIGEDQ